MADRRRRGERERLMAFRREALRTVPLMDDRMLRVLARLCPYAIEEAIRAIARDDGISILSIGTQVATGGPGDRGDTFDIVAYGDRGDIYGMESQRHPWDMPRERALHYSCRLGDMTISIGGSWSDWMDPTLIVIYWEPVDAAMPQVAESLLRPYNGNGHAVRLIEVNAKIREGRIGMIMADLSEPAAYEKRSDAFIRARERLMKEEEESMESSDRIWRECMREFEDDIRQEAIEETNMELAMRLRENGKLTGEEILELTGIDVRSLG